MHFIRGQVWSVNIATGLSFLRILPAALSIFSILMEPKCKESTEMLWLKHFWEGTWRNFTWLVNCHKNEGHLQAFPPFLLFCRVWLVIRLYFLGFTSHLYTINALRFYARVIYSSLHLNLLIVVSESSSRCHFVLLKICSIIK